ncbi:MAG TPA: phage tail assembly chaperone [Micropepsaceae bacterium]|nr:phage tail assembly chaperone [Micropepsaceae bacterium]
MMGLAPETFWNMTLVEWRAAFAGFAQRHGLRVASTTEPMCHSQLLNLMQLYPDTNS